MSWESERPNVILTLESIDEIEEIYTSASKLFPGLNSMDYYIIKSRDPDWIYGICIAKHFFKVIKKIMLEQAYSGNDDTETINHWRWIPRISIYANDKKSRPEGGSLVHYYTTKDISQKDPTQMEYSKLSEMNQGTQDHWNEMNSNVIKPPFYRGGDPLKKMGIGIKFEDLWWCKSNLNIGFSSKTKKEIILEI